MIEADRVAATLSGAAAPRPVDCGLKGLCPRCGARGLFAGAVRFATACPACGLRFADFNVGDGPAAFLVLILGAIVVALATVLEVSASPPWWLHVLLWLPLTTIGVIGSLRVAKGWLLAAEYRSAAREGRITP